MSWRRLRGGARSSGLHWRGRVFNEIPLRDLKNRIARAPSPAPAPVVLLALPYLLLRHPADDRPVSYLVIGAIPDIRTEASDKHIL